MRAWLSVRGDEPFALAPDPRFVFGSSSFRSAILALTDAIEGRAGLMAVVGEAGCGKTLLLRTIQQTLARNRRPAFFRFLPCKSAEALLASLVTGLQCAPTGDFLPRKSADDLLASMLAELQLTSIPADRESRLDELARCLARRPSPAVLLIDEAGRCDNDQLCELAELSEWRNGEPNNLQVVLAGRPELLERLQGSGVGCRMAARVHLDPLGRDELGAYVAHRLAVSRCKTVLVEPTALDQVFRYSQGSPMWVNRLCAWALADKRARIDVARVNEAAFICGLDPLPNLIAPGMPHTPRLAPSRGAKDVVSVHPATSSRGWMGVCAASVAVAAGLCLGFLTSATPMVSWLWILPR